MKSALPVAAVTLGVVLLAISFLWAIVFPASASWTPEKSEKLTSLGNRATEIQLQLDKAQTRPSMHSGQNPAELKEELEKVSAEYKVLYAEFSGASKAPESSSRFLRWAGIAFVVAGGLTVFATRGA
jgi:hypothetical protein